MDDGYLGWTPRDVAARLTAAGHSAVAGLFLESEIAGAMLPFLTEDHLKDLGVASVGQRLLAFQYIANIVGAPESERTLKCQKDRGRTAGPMRAVRKRTACENTAQEATAAPKVGTVEESEGMVPCPICGRAFSEEGQKHHAPVCERMRIGKKSPAKPGGSK
jgi:hypothetical protein